MTLQQIGEKYGTDKATAHRYCDFYQKYLPNPEYFTGRLLEIGVKDGASLRMWREYYPHAQQIVGIDINPPIHVPGCDIIQMDQCDIYALGVLGAFDIIIDDGSHMTLHQQISFHTLFFYQLNLGGIYVMEDLHTSFYDGYINSKQTTVEVLDALKNNSIYKQIEWCRVDDKHDSLTRLIFAP